MAIKSGYEHYKTKMIEIVNNHDNKTKWIPSSDLKQFCEDNGISRATMKSHIIKTNPGKYPNFVKRPLSPSFKFSVGQVLTKEEYKSRYPDNDI